MQFIADGPDIPLEVLQAHEERQLVLFCGAGISRRAGLPDFGGLVEQVCQGLGARLSSLEQKECSRGNYDRALGLLEGEGRFAPAQVRAEVHKVLATPHSPQLDTHQALLDLAREPDGGQRLVTTNFDLLFEAAEPHVRITAAPLLPVPKPHKWNSLVYLHGRLDDEHPDGRHLVLTSADFGAAYLVERWASRFVAELFNHCTVLFIGYSVGDPVMRYLIDAIAAERRSDRRIHDTAAYRLPAAGPGAPAQSSTWSDGRGACGIADWALRVS